MTVSLVQYGLIVRVIFGICRWRMESSWWDPFLICHQGLGGLMVVLRMSQNVDQGGSHFIVFSSDSPVTVS